MTWVSIIIRVWVIAWIIITPSTFPIIFISIFLPRRRPVRAVTGSGTRTFRLRIPIAPRLHVSGAVVVSVPWVILSIAVHVIKGCCSGVCRIRWWIRRLVSIIWISVVAIRVLRWTKGILRSLRQRWTLQVLLHTWHG